MDDIAAFIRVNTRLRPVPHVPEIVLQLADEAVPLWRQTEEDLQQIGLPPPFWAFAWSGGQAVARYVLDHPEQFAGRRVLDLGSGSGLVAIAAAKAGAAPVVAADIDRFTEIAIELNAAANAVHVEVLRRDLLDDPESALPGYDAILVGDLFYERDTACRAFAYLRRQAAGGAQVLIGDPGRAYLPKHALRRLAEYSVPVTRELEDQEIKCAAVWTFT